MNQCRPEVATLLPAGHVLMLLAAMDRREQDARIEAIDDVTDRLAREWPDLVRPRHDFDGRFAARNTLR